MSLKVFCCPICKYSCMYPPPPSPSPPLPISVTTYFNLINMQKLCDYSVPDPQAKTEPFGTILAVRPFLTSNSSRALYVESL